MRLVVRQTSLVAWDCVRESLGLRQKVVYQLLLALGPVTNAELAEVLGWRINTVTPRVNELVKRGIVQDAGVRACDVTGHNAHTWRASE